MTVLWMQMYGLSQEVSTYLQDFDDNNTIVQDIKSQQTMNQETVQTLEQQLSSMQALLS